MGAAATRARMVLGKANGRHSMTIVEGYVFRIALSAFLGGLGALTGVIWVTQALKQVDLLTTKGQTLLVFMALTGLTLPSLIAIIAPIAIFV
eukprot:gene39956-48828_t